MKYFAAFGRIPKLERKFIEEMCRMEQGDYSTSPSVILRNFSQFRMNTKIDISLIKREMS